MLSVLNNPNYFEYQTNKSLRFLIKWNMVQIATNTHSSVTTTIQTTSLRSSDGVLSRWLHVSLLFALKLESLDFKDMLKLCYLLIMYILHYLLYFISVFNISPWGYFFMPVFFFFLLIQESLGCHRLFIVYKVLESPNENNNIPVTKLLSYKISFSNRQTALIWKRNSFNQKKVQ